MIFIQVAKFRKKPDKEFIDKAAKLAQEEAKDGVKLLGWYWTLGRYDAVRIVEAKNEEQAMKWSIRFAELAAVETLVAVKREDAVKLL